MDMLGVLVFVGLFIALTFLLTVYVGVVYRTRWYIKKLRAMGYAARIQRTDIRKLMRNSFLGAISGVVGVMFLYLTIPQLLACFLSANCASRPILSGLVFLAGFCFTLASGVYLRRAFRVWRNSFRQFKSDYQKVKNGKRPNLPRRIVRGR